MAITFSQTKKRQRYLLIILGLVAISILAVLLAGRERAVPTAAVPGKAEIFRPPEIKINLNVLKEFPELKAFEGIAPFDGRIGRGNPFTPY